MVSISHVVEDIVKHRPYLSESLAAGITCSSPCPAIAARCGESVAEGSEYRGYCDGLESVGALFAGAGAGAVE